MSPGSEDKEGQQGWLPPAAPPRAEEPGTHRWRQGSKLISTRTATHYYYYYDIINFPTSHLQLFGAFISICSSIRRWKLKPGIYTGVTHPLPSSSHPSAPTALHHGLPGLPVWVRTGTHGPTAPPKWGFASSRAAAKQRNRMQPLRSICWESLATLGHQSITINLSFQILSF